MYSGTHRAILRQDMSMHKYNTVRIILQEWIAIICRESLFHADAKSRDGLPDMQHFSYVWPDIPGNSRNRTKGSKDGLAREHGDQVYPDNITNKICKDFYKQDVVCLNCCNEEEIVGLRSIPPWFYSPGQRIIGCLEELGWVVIRGIIIEETTYETINTIANSEHNGRATKAAYWTSIEERNNKRVVKYKHNSNPHVNWSKDKNCSIFLEEIKAKLDQILKGGNYVIGKFNLIINNGGAPSYQQAHTDYQPRQAK